MARNVVGQILKKEVAQRANFRCEYCLLSEKVSLFRFHIEHIKSIKHGGNNDIQNLAYCCPDCNFHKGSDIATMQEDDTLIRFFNPRKDNWFAHFEIDNGAINGKTAIGDATVRIFKFNEIDRLIFRQELMEMLLYP
jgi:WD40 repeat protein